MDVFLSHSSSDTELAERLAQGLDAHGLTVWLDSERLKPGDDWQHEIAEAIRSAKIAVMLIDRDSESDQSQQSTWQAILEAVWQDPRKRLVPVLKRDAHLPEFVQSASSTDEALVLRLGESLELGNAIQAIVEISEGRASSREDDGGGAQKVGNRADRLDYGTRAELLDFGVADGGGGGDQEVGTPRADRLDYIERILSKSRDGK